MNLLFHFFSAYSVCYFAFGGVREHILLIFIVSIFIDLDHIPHILKARQQILGDGFGSASRTFLHELLGLSLLSAALCFLLSFSLLPAKIAEIVALSLGLHFGFDFLFGKTRPFYPFSREEISLIKVSKKQKAYLEFILTVVLGVVFWITVA
ncbi:MAG: hypothetical protein GF334_08305 [Candidatus Altiarchaeales archaeon]|nr:hypothetical protein [Candidatus Altiarchaeales archaeon]